MKKYNATAIEKKWQKHWEEEKTFEVTEDKQKQKYYTLFEFPYPSGEGLHVGHQRPYTAMDIIARKKRMEGCNVMLPMGFDAFGLPAENYAIKTGKPPAEITQKNIANFTRQLKNVGYSFDWSRVVDTTDSKYYKWTQWIFLQLFKHGLAYKKNQPINWCPKDKIGLANEEVVNGCCERCGTPVEKRNKEQWMLAITKYADKLLEGLKEVDYIPQARTQQENWIGKSEGAEINFILDFKKNPKDNERRDAEGKPAQLKVFTTRPDTLFGATYLVMAPEHLWVTLATDEKHDVLENKAEVIDYLQQVKNKTEIERTSDQKEKTGVELKGVKALHPITNEELPIWVADYVLGNYGTGVIMAVPAHDERDFEFAEKFNLPIKPVIAKHFIETENPPRKDKPTVRRKTIHAIVKRKSDGSILMLKWKANQRPDGTYPYTFVIGGVEEGEDVVKSALRELEEETGITKATFVRELPIAVQTEYFAGHKDQNRYSEITVLYFEVEGKVEINVSEEESKNHDPIWVPEQEVVKTINIIDGPYIWQQFLKTTPLTENGILCNSDFLNGLDINKANEKILQWLEEHQAGERKVQYKLRDWVFSRQRYWGEPIPLVYCENCARTKEDVFIFHGWEDSSQSGFIPTLKKDLEAKGYNVFAFDAPNTEEPNFDTWFAFAQEKIETHKTGAPLNFVGHSMGGHLAAKLAEKYKLNRLVLVAPVGFEPGEKYFSQFKDKINKDELQIFKDYQDHSLDVKAVKKNVESIQIIFGLQDPWITEEIRNQYQTSLGDVARFNLMPSAGHLSESEGVKKLPVVEKLFNSREQNGWVPLPENQLPLELPKVEKYEPTDTGESPLSKMEDWVNTTCPKCGGPAKRETDTMPNWAGSSWYFLRYCDPHNDKDFFKEPNFKFRPGITPTSKDQEYFDAFKAIYSDLERMNINIWAGNRLLLNGVNRALWLPLRTVAVMAWEKDLEKIAEYLQVQGYRIQKKEKYGWYFEKDEIKVEVIPVFQENGKIVSYSPQGAPQPMTINDLSEVEFGNLFGFSYRTVSPEYNLAHYKFINEHEIEDRKGLGDDEKIKFLEDLINSKNSKIRYWNQVDWYNGGMEHTVLHLLYSRFWNQFLFDIGLVPTREPYKKRTSHGLILAKGGEKMSKSKGNVVNPDDIVEEYGADALRMYMMFMGPFDQAAEWDTNGLVGVRRFLERVWNLQEKISDTNEMDKKAITQLHQTIKKVSADIEAMHFNTAISAMMELVNELTKTDSITRASYESFLKILSPFAPHVTNELWQEILGNKTELAFESWPHFDSELAKSEEFELVIQVNGKVRDTIMVATEISEQIAKEQALASEKVQKWLDGKEPKKVIYVKGKLVSIVV